MQFDYGVPVEEYAAAQVLYVRSYARGHLVKRALGWALPGLLFVMIAVWRWRVDWTTVLLLVTGAWFIYAGIILLFPARHYRKHYPASGMAGKHYHAEFDEQGFLVSGDGCTWRVPWSEARQKAEDERVFMFSGKGTIFAIGKKYLTEEQQKVIRELAALP